jgi:hypothetical protein
MKPDPEYLRRLLAAFEDAPGPTTDIVELEKAGLSYQTDEFYFHLRLLSDQDFAEREDSEPGLGVERTCDPELLWCPFPLRLTASGHEFAGALNNNTAYAAVKKSGEHSSIAIMRDIAVAVVKSVVFHELHLS